ncbi:MAG: chromate efflux transporter [Elusimicrobia bacterium]|nr:chromate efflux transporter [Elusimicrobiota bacterium]
MGAPSTRELVSGFLKVGLTSFGGPLVAMSLIHQEAVERKRWVTPQWFAQTLGILQAVPGPSAFEMSLSIGIATRGRLGGLACAAAYMLPGFFLMLALSAAYFHLGQMPAAARTLAALGPAALAVLGIVCVRLTRKLVVDRLDWALWAAALAACLAGVPVGGVVVLGGAASLSVRRPSAAGLALVPFVLLGAGPGSLERLPSLFFGMLKAGALIVGGGYNIAAFVSDDFVARRGWLSPEEFLAGFALAQFKPGPIILLSVFVGYRVAGALGAVVAAAGVFLPCVSTLLALGPGLERLRGGPRAGVFLSGMGVAATASVVAAAVEMLPAAVSAPRAVVVFVVALAALQKLEPGVVLAAAALAGLLVP